MTKILFLFCLLLTTPCIADTTACTKWPGWFKPACERLTEIWTKGDNEVILTGYAWHNRYTYRPEKIHSFNENAWGGGVAKGFYDEKGNFHNLVAIAFLDSHNHVQPLVGYAYLKILPLTTHAKIGVGATVFLTSRVDIFNSVPFPGALPWVSFIYDKVTLSATYIPGSKGAGNVLFLVGKYTF